MLFCRYLLPVALLLAFMTTLNTDTLQAQDVATGKHLFILSGQSNMAGMDPKASFTPAVEKQFGKQQVIVVKHARGGQPIRRWYKQWQPSSGQPVSKPESRGDLYDALMTAVGKAIEGQEIRSVTFVWMQGERDAKTNEVAVYKDSLKGLVQQIRDDLKRDDVNVVIGKLGSGQLHGRAWSENWAKLRNVQEEACSEDPRWMLIDCDDLEMKKDQLHFTPEGYKGMGQRFADAAIKLISQ